MSEINNYSSCRNTSEANNDCSMNVIAYKNGFRNYDENQSSPYQQTLMHRSATHNRLSSSNGKESNFFNNWPNKGTNWLSASGRFSSSTFYSMLSSSLSNLSINAFNYKLEFSNFQLLKVEPIDLANQITIFDVQLFRNIKQEEILGFGWKTPRKAVLAPNITAYTRRFNQISFWTINEILLANFKHNPHLLKNPHCTATSLLTLNELESIKCRTAVLSHFIKIAKKLYLLNNIQSCYAIISALNSSSIYRLNKTWNQVSKKDKKSFEEMSKLFSEDNNFENLRLHLKTIKGNYVPYLGMYFKDLIYIDTAHPKDKKNNTVNFQREMKIRETVQQILDSLTTSHYDNLVVNETIRSYLQSINYVEELQKFMEEDYFKLSLKLEPVESKLSKSNKTLYENKTSINQSTFYLNPNELNDLNSTKKSRTSLNNSFQFHPNNSKLSNNNNSLINDKLKNDIQRSNVNLSKKNFKPSHRKSLSLGANNILSNHNLQTELKKPEIIDYKNRYLVDDTLIEENYDSLSTCNEEVKFNKIPSTNSIHSQVNNFEDQQSDIQISITSNLDESDIKEKLSNLDSDKNSLTDFILPKNVLNIIYQGYIKRKTILRENKKPTLSTWVRYWVILNSTGLIFYSSKSLRGCSRSHFKSTPTKCISLRSSLIKVKLDEESCSMDCFLLTDDNEKNIYKFKTNTQLEAITWCREISNILANPSFNF